jgi:Bifunctional DNA primase/polymerase, N-terminal
MPDRYPIAAKYRAQGFWPVPCEPGGKKAAVKWSVYQRRQMTTQEMHAAWPPKGDANIALVLGPAARLLCLNVNMKHGQNGLRTLNGYTIPATPTILTPHEGFAYLFRVPDRERYPFAFRVHPRVRGHHGIELRGAGGYQLVPSSHVDATARDPAGDYRLADGWTLARLMVDLADVPDWLLDLWIWCEDGARNVADDEPATTGNTRQAASGAAHATDPTLPSPTPPHRQSRVRPTHRRARAPNRNY